VLLAASLVWSVDSVSRPLRAGQIYRSSRSSTKVLSTSSSGSGIVLEGQPSRLEVREEYSRWLLSVFGYSEELTLGTFTFRNLDLPNYRPGLQRVTVAAQRLVGLLASNGTSGFVVVEVGTDTRRLHLHSLSNLDSRRIQVVGLWWREKYGHRKIDIVYSRGGVSDYVTKYVTKSDMPFFADGPLFRTHN